MGEEEKVLQEALEQEETAQEPASVLDKAAQVAKETEAKKASAAPASKGFKRGPFKNMSKRAATILAVVVAVVAVGGIGMYKWHETPSFCTAICHTPMDAKYLDTLYANPYEPSVDKWGNEVAYSGAMLASLHGNMGKECMDCHEPQIEEQVTEGIEWVAGNYYNPLSERDLSRLVFYAKKGETEFCLKSGCHDITKDGLTGLTEDMARNPHSWHHNEYTCSDCHKAHRASVMICSQCHEDAEIPRGWLTWDEAKKLDTQYMSYEDERFLAEAE